MSLVEGAWFAQPDEEDIWVFVETEMIDDIYDNGTEDGTWGPPMVTAGITDAANLLLLAIRPFGRDPDSGDGADAVKKSRDSVAGC